MSEDRNGVFESAVISDTFATEVVSVQRMGANVRIVFAAQQVVFDGTGGVRERVVVAKLILPADAIPLSLARIAEAESDPAKNDLRERRVLSLVN